MDIELTVEQRAFVQDAVGRGRLRDEADAVREALRLWEERERSRAEILAAVDAAEESLAAGKGRVVTDHSMRALAAEVKERGRARLEAKQNEAA